MRADEPNLQLAHNGVKKRCFSKLVAILLRRCSRRRGVDASVVGRGDGAGGPECLLCRQQEPAAAGLQWGKTSRPVDARLAER